jgi:DNA polymerase-4
MHHPSLTILHVDMDAFYAAVEQRDQPELRGRPVIVGGTSGRAVVSAASYEARAYGVHSALPMATAQRLCPQGVFLPVRMAHYAEISQQLREIFFSFTPLVEPLSLDEAFLDVRGCEGLFGPGPVIARQIKDRIKSVTGLVASVGVAPNKFLSKLASDVGKPDGFVVVPPDRVREFLAPLPVGRLWGAAPRPRNGYRPSVSTPSASWRRCLNRFSLPTSARPGATCGNWPTARTAGPSCQTGRPGL